jgi:DNA-binding NtrC family response regulator
MTTRTVLVVDDEFSIRRLLARILRNQGVQVIAADTVATAEMLLLYNHVDLILCDHEMPGEKGLTFLRRLGERYPDMVRALITGHMDFAMTVEAINDAQVHYCITKPFEVEEIQELVTDLLSWGDRRHQAPGRAFTQQQRADLRILAEHHPGIADVRRDTRGAILLEGELAPDEDWPVAGDGGHRNAPDPGVIELGDDFARLIGA